MRINVLVTGGLLSSQSGYSAFRFCQAARAAGHTLTQIFFYASGVEQATSLAVPLSDEFDAPSAWKTFAAESGADLIVCVSASERRGVLGEVQALEAGRTSHNLLDAFKVEGLGVLHDASLSSDRMVTFK